MTIQSRMKELTKEELREISGGMNLEGREESTNVIDIRREEAAALWAAGKAGGVAEALKAIKS